MQKSVRVRKELCCYRMSLTSTFVQRQRLQHVASSSSPVKWDSGIKSSRRPEIPLLNESPNDIQSTSTYSSRRTQSASDSFQRLGFDLLVSPHDNTNEYGRLLSSSMGQPYQQIPPPTNLVNLNPWGSPSSDMSFVCGIFFKKKSILVRLPECRTCHIPKVAIVLIHILDLQNLTITISGGFLQTNTWTRQSIW